MVGDLIFKRGSDGKLRSWFYEVNGNQYRTVAGLLGGVPVTSAWTTCTGKQKRSDEAQARFEAQAEESKKLAREYRRTISELESVPLSPMLAQDYGKLKAPLEFPVYVQPKLDGIRALINHAGAFSREFQPHNNIDHIIASLAPVWEAFPGITLDGELYNHDLKDDFGKIASVVRKQKADPAQRAESERLIEYHVYDVLLDGTAIAETKFALRMILMEQLNALPLPQCIRFVSTSRVTSQEALDKAHGKYLEAGYEGSMVRLNTPYEPDTRSKTLLKRKEFITGEFDLLRVEEGSGNWAGYAKRAVFSLGDGKECGAGIRGTREEMRALITRPTPPKSVTIRYFTPTPDGVPRFPVAIDFQDEQRVD